MSRYKVSLKWKGDLEDFTHKKYNRSHKWIFGGGRNKNNKLAVIKVNLRPRTAFT
jgi:hypothetical protein